MSKTFFSLVTELESLLESLNVIISGSDSETVRVNGETKDSLSKAVKDKFTELLDGFKNGILSFKTYEDLSLYKPTSEQEKAVFKVSNDPDSSLNGYYSWLSGTSYEKSDPLVSNVFDKKDKSEPVSAYAVFNEIKQKITAVVGVNKFNKNDEEFTFNSIVSNINGNLSASSTYNTSGFIPVKPNTPYHIGGDTNGEYYQIAFYNKNKTFIEGDSGSNVTTGANVAYLRVSFRNPDTFQVTEGGSKIEYEPYNEILPSNALPLKTINSKHLMRNGVNTDDTAFLQPRKNLFNNTDPQSQLLTYINEFTGLAQSSSSYNSTGFISVMPNKEYTTSSARSCVFYDEDFNFISGIQGSSSGSTFTTPANTGYVRISATLEKWDALQVELGRVATEYSPYQVAFKELRGIPVVVHAKDGGSGVIEDESITRKLIADEAINTQKVDFIKPGKNLFNSQDPLVEMGRSINVDQGFTYEHTRFNVTGFIPVEEDTTYFISNYRRKVVFYDINKNYISGTEHSPYKAGAITTPNNTAFMRASIDLEFWDDYQVELGDSFTDYESFRLNLIHPGGIPIKEVKDDVVFQKQLAIAPVHYITPNEEIAIYYENIARNSADYIGHTEIAFDTAKETGRSSSGVFKVADIGNNVAGTATLFDSNFEVVESDNFTIKITDPTITNPVVIQNLGSSTTARSTWTEVLNNSPAGANVTYVGNRNSNSTTGRVKCEGQGGWTVNSFLTVDYNGYLSPFMQPVNTDYLYYGRTSFWIDANSENPSYNAKDFDDLKSSFDASSGYKLNPNVNDIMRNGSEYVVWDGNSWSAISESTFSGFKFNYTQYRAAWGISSPDIVHILLGSNNFAAGYKHESFKSTYQTFKACYDEMFASILADNPNTKIVIGLTYSSGRQGENGSVDTERRKLGYHSLAANLISDYSGRENEGIYLIDYHSILDRVHGFDRVETPPFSGYSGDLAKDTYVYDTTHASAGGFLQMGRVYMGLIQHLR